MGLIKDCKMISDRSGLVSQTGEDAFIAASQANQEWEGGGYPQEAYLWLQRYW